MGKTKTKPEAKITSSKAIPTIVWVDPHYIGTATRGDAMHCMVANAVREQLDLSDAATVNVDGVTIDIRDKNGREVYRETLEPATQKRIRDWDQNKDPKPFTVELNIDREAKQKLQGK